MNFGEMFRSRLDRISTMVLGLSMAVIPTFAAAQEAATAEPATAEAAVEGAGTAVEAASAYTPLGPEMIKGQPEPGGIWFQPQHNEVGRDALFMNDVVLMPIITVISLFVLFLLIWVIVRYNKRANPTPSRTSHNTLLEVLWTGLPILILVGIAVPSVNLLLKQFEPAPEEALTIKTNGYQWYWGYEYVDNGGFEVVSNMLPEEEAEARGEPPQLAVDNRMVVPVGVPIRIQTYGADVIHSFAVPSLWFKLDAVPGQLNEKVLQIDEPGIYYGQCSELCGARHGYMPIAVEAVPMEQFEAWVLLQGGTLGNEEAAEAPAVEGGEEAATEETASEA